MKRPWMPLYIADYLADTQHLSTHEHGAYLLLLMNHWQLGYLPGDDAVLARMARVYPPHWPRVKRALMPFFQIKENGLWYSKRLCLELTKIQEISNKRKAAALQMHSKCSANAPTLHTSQSKKDKKDDAYASSKEARPAAATVEKRSPAKSLIKTALPDGYVLSERMINYALDRGWDHARLQDEFEKFCLHAQKHDCRYANWDAAWMSWVRSPYQASGGSNGRRNYNPGRLTGVQQAEQLAALVRARERQESAAGTDDLFRRADGSYGNVEILSPKRA